LLVSKEVAVNILVVNASPRGKQGNSYVLQEAFVSGALSSGAQVKEVFLKSQKIKPCLGCMVCWIRTPGKCIQKDDQAELLEKCVWADLLVLVTPLYVDGMTAQAKTFFDRLIPLGHPEFILEGGHCRHPPMHPKNWKFLLMSNCGFHEMDNFDALIMHCQRICMNFRCDYLGHLLRPHGPLMGLPEIFGEAIGRVTQATARAAEEIVRTGLLSESAMTEVSAEIVPRDVYIQMVNSYWSAEKDKAASEG
jgi:putative NADPH-quinone reductase